MTSRERIIAALNHQTPDKVPLDLGGTSITGMGVNAVIKLRESLGLEKKAIKVREPYQMLGAIDYDLIEMLGVDVVSPIDYKSMFSFTQEQWKPFQFHNDDVLVAKDFNTEFNKDGSLYMYPKGNKNVRPSAIMPNDGWYFDTIIRQYAIDDDNLNVEDNLEEFSIKTDEELKYWQTEINNIYKNTDKAIVGNLGGTALGDIALVPAPGLEDPKGIRDIEEWYISTAIRQDYIKELFERQIEIALKNLKLYYEAAGNKIQAIVVCGTDFGTQNSPFISTDMFNTLYLPYYKKINNWIHENTEWKTFKHSCGSIYPLIPSFIEAGFDILNPVQISANNMDSKKLKKEFGEKIVFWGGGVNTQKELPFGTEDEVREQVKKQIKILGEDGGFVFNPVHNVQGNTPVENLISMYQTVKEYR